MWSTGLFSRCTERAQQAALSHSFEDSQRTEGCPGGCALMGKVSQHGHCRWCCLEMPFRGWAVIGRLAKFLLLRSSDHWQTRKNRISNVGLSHAGETSLGQRFEARSVNVTGFSEHPGPVPSQFQGHQLLKLCFQ